MNRSTPKPTFFNRKREFFVFCLVLAAIALIFHRPSSGPRLTISGLDLDDTRRTVANRLKGEDFRFFNVSESEEHWYKMDTASINVTYDHNDSVQKLEGGVPEIDGIEVSRWSPDQFQATLGPPSFAGQSRAVGESRTGHLSYPQHRSLIYFEQTGNRFILFESGR